VRLTLGLCDGRSSSEKLKEILMLDSNTLIEYKFHANSIRDMSTFRNAKPYVFAASTPSN